MSTLNAKNRMVFGRYRIGDQLVVTNNGNDEVKFCVLKGFGLNAVNELILRLETVGEIASTPWTIHPGNTGYTIEKV